MDWPLMGAFLLLMAPSCTIMDSFLTKQEKRKDEYTIIKWFACLDDFTYKQAIRQSNIFCNKLLDRLYGEKHFSWRCFGVSCLVSLFAVSVLTIIVIACKVLNPGEYIDGVLKILLLAVLLNIWVDYVSLVETRMILRYAARVKPMMLPVLLLADLVLCAAIYLLFDQCIGTILCLASRQQLSFDLLGAIKVAFIPSNDNADANVAFYSTFSASFFFHLYCLSAVFFKIVKLSKTRLMTFLEWLEDSGNLCKALGTIITALVAIVLVIRGIIQHIAGN